MPAIAFTLLAQEPTSQSFRLVCEEYEFTCGAHDLSTARGYAARTFTNLYTSFCETLLKYPHSTLRLTNPRVTVHAIEVSAEEKSQLFSQFRRIEHLLQHPAGPQILETIYRAVDGTNTSLAMLLDMLDARMQTTPRVRQRKL